MNDQVAVFRPFEGASCAQQARFRPFYDQVERDRTAMSAKNRYNVTTAVIWQKRVHGVAFWRMNSMSEERVVGAIQRVLPVIETGQDLSENDTRRKIIDPILRSLGWEPGYGRGNRRRDCITEYYPYEDSDVRADYAMFESNGREVIIVEAKRLLEDTRDHYAQLDHYMQGGKDLVGVLTNGEFWNICYLDRRGRLTEDRPVGLASRSPSESAGRLFRALAKSNWH